MIDEAKKLLEEIKSASAQIKNIAQWKEFKAKYLGKKGKIQEMIKSLRHLPSEQKRATGEILNKIKREAEELFETLKKKIELEEKREQLLSIEKDPSLPSEFFIRGSLHPITLVLREIVDIFARMGFELREGPEIETDYYNFEALNIPRHHPARDMHDTFYFDETYLLRTHTSPVQIRVMEKEKPPIKIIAIGKVYRKDADVSHSPMFHQVEGLYVDKDVSFAQLKGTLEQFAIQFFGEGTVVRFRPSYFPFTEPSAEMDIKCIFCGGKGCRTCGGSGWIEILGAGMVHPKVLREVKIDPEKFTGFAFGMGVERMAMLKYSIDDIRVFFDNDLRVLEQF